MREELIEMISNSDDEKMIKMIYYFIISYQEQKSQLNS